MEWFKAIYIIHTFGGTQYLRSIEEGNLLHIYFKRCPKFIEDKIWFQKHY